MFKISVQKDGHKLGLQTPEAMKLFGGTKKLIDKIKNGENVSSIEVAEVVLVQCIYQTINNKKGLTYYILSRPINAYLLNVEASILVILKTYITEFGDVIIKFTDKSVIPLEKGGKISLTMINRNDPIC